MESLFLSVNVTVIAKDKIAYQIPLILLYKLHTEDALDDLVLLNLLFLTIWDCVQKRWKQFGMKARIKF